MNTSKQRKTWLILGACVGLIIGFVIGPRVETNMRNGSFVQWESLGSPEGKISSILAVDLASYSDSFVYVETSDGEIYQRLLRNCQTNNQLCWVKISTLGATSPSNISDHCISRYRMKNPPFPIVQCVSSEGGVGLEFLRETHLALLEDGNIWLWEHSSGRMSLNSLIASALKCIIIPGIGFLVGWGTILILLALSKRSNNQSKRKLSKIKSKIDQLANLIGAPQNILPTYGYSEHTARPHIEADSKGYHFVVAERGKEYERHTSFDMDEILYDVFQGVTFELACKYELNYRINGQDPRRIMFEYQEELLSKLSSSWSERRIREHAHILEKHPFNDVFNPVSAYAQELKEQGFPPEVRWKMARDKFYPPKED